MTRSGQDVARNRVKNPGPRGATDAGRQRNAAEKQSVTEVDGNQRRRLARRRNPDLTTHRATDLDVTHALEQVAVPAYVVDRNWRIRWLNRGAVEIVGSRLGQPFSRVIAPEDLHLARAHFAKKLIG